MRLAGLLARHTSFCLPVAKQRGSGQWKEACTNDLQLREQPPVSTGFPFNPGSELTHHIPETKCGAKVILFAEIRFDGIKKVGRRLAGFLRFFIYKDKHDLAFVQ